MESSEGLEEFSNAGDLKEAITLTEVILNSLDDADTLPEEREAVEKKLASLKAQLDRMEPARPLPQWGGFSAYSPAVDPNGSHSPSSFWSNVPLQSNALLSSPQSSVMDLPRRKRLRSLDVENNEESVRSKRPSPIPPTASPPLSIDSSNTEQSDDPILRDLLGTSYQTSQREQMEAERLLQERLRQEKEDAAFAQSLAAQWERDTQAEPFSTTAPTRTSNLTQSYMHPNGSFQRSSGSQPTNFSEPRNSRTEVSTPTTDSSGALEEVSANDWARMFGTSTGRGNGSDFELLSSLQSIPGSFPASEDLFANQAGSSVYGYPLPYATSYNSYTPRFGGPHNSVGRGLHWDPLRGNVRRPAGAAFDDTFADLSELSSSSYRPQDHDYVVDSAKTQEEIKELLKHIRPDDELTPEQMREAQPDGLQIDLMPHQRKGFAWMKSMEEGTNKGGILADDMGLGKTAQAISLIMARQSEDPNRRPTLVVTPVALMQQWEQEIKRFIKSSHRLSVFIMHQGPSRNKPWNFLKGFDIIITTYGTLATDFKRSLQWANVIKQLPDAQPTPQQQCPLLGKNSIFHRIILDEAQNIKNRNTKAAQAACHVNATYRWALSGTPMQNNVDEIYSLIKFCRIKPYNDYERFARDIGRPIRSNNDYTRVMHLKEKAMEKLQALLRATLLRRTKKSEIDGKPILQLPEKHIVEDRAVFSEDELDFYKALESKAQIQFNKYLQNGTIGQNYSNALVLLLRLRQCCCSPLLVRNAKDFIAASSNLENIDYVENARTLPDIVVRRLGENEAWECPICMDAVENPIIFNPCGHALCAECLTSMTEKALNDGAGLKLSCPHCRGEVDPNKVTNLESFLGVHFPEREGAMTILDTRPAASEDDGATETDTDSESASDNDDTEDDESDDGDDLRNFIVPDTYESDAESGSGDTNGGHKLASHKFKPDPYGSDIEFGSDEELDDPKLNSTKPKSNSRAESAKPTMKKGKSKKAEKGKARGRRKGKGKARDKPKRKALTLADLRREGLRNQNAKRKYLRRLKNGFETSAKIEKTLSLLREIRDRKRGERAIVFSSFTSFLDLLEVPLSEDAELDNYARYDGSMRARDRNDAVHRFSNDPNCRIILVSLKAGNAGLNLTAANHVILLDPFWNPFVEYQAADRCYRIGQTREVFVHRILIGENEESGPSGVADRDFTVEDRILKLQEKKRQLVESAFDETAGGNIARLSARELGFLFGVNNVS